MYRSDMFEKGTLFGKLIFTVIARIFDSFVHRPNVYPKGIFPFGYTFFVHSQDSPDLNQHFIPKCVILMYFFNFPSLVHFFHIVGKLNVVYV